MAVSVGTVEYVTLVYPLRCTVQRFAKGLRSSGAASSANIPVLTAPWRTSPALPDPPQEETSLEDSAVGQTFCHNCLLGPPTTLFWRAPYGGKQSWIHGIHLQHQKETAQPAPYGGYQIREVMINKN